MSRATSSSPVLSLLGAAFMPSRNLVASLLVLLIFSSSPMASALSFSSQPEATQVLAMASLAFRGQVLETHSFALFSSQPEGVLYTEVTLKVERAYRGTRDGAIVILRHVGGQLSTGEGMGIAGVPWLQPGERVSIFANDNIHPFFGALYADLGLRRFVEHEGQTITLTAHHKPLFATAVANSGDVECATSEQQPAQCEAWVSPDGDPASAPAAGTLLTAEAFDAWVFANLGEAPRDPAQIYMDDASFRAALADWIALIDTPVADSDAR